MTDTQPDLTPVLVKMVREVQALHRPDPEITDVQQALICMTCGMREPWPCATARAVYPSSGSLPNPMLFPCRTCEAGVGQACKPIGVIGYHEMRYAAAGWPVDD